MLLLALTSFILSKFDIKNCTYAHIQCHKLSVALLSTASTKWMLSLVKRALFSSVPFLKT